MTRKLGIGAVHTGQNNWQARTSTAWQRERMHGPIIPLSYPKKGWLRRLLG